MEKLQAIYLSFLLNKYILVTCFFLSGSGHNVLKILKIHFELMQFLNQHFIYNIQKVCMQFKSITFLSVNKSLPPKWKVPLT